MTTELEKIRSAFIYQSLLKLDQNLASEFKKKFKPLNLIESSPTLDSAIIHFMTTSEMAKNIAYLEDSNDGDGNKPRDKETPGKALRKSDTKEIIPTSIQGPSSSKSVLPKVSSGIKEKSLKQEKRKTDNAISTPETTSKRRNKSESSRDTSEESSKEQDYLMHSRFSNSLGCICVTLKYLQNKNSQPQDYINDVKNHLNFLLASGDRLKLDIEYLPSSE